MCLVFLVPEVETTSQSAQRKIDLVSGSAFKTTGLHARRYEAGERSDRRVLLMEGGDEKVGEQGDVV